MPFPPVLRFHCIHGLVIAVATAAFDLCLLSGRAIRARRRTGLRRLLHRYTRSRSKRRSELRLLLLLLLLMVWLLLLLLGRVSHEPALRLPGTTRPRAWTRCHMGCGKHCVERIKR